MIGRCSISWKRRLRRMTTQQLLWSYNPSIKRLFQSFIVFQSCEMIRYDFGFEIERGMEREKGWRHTFPKWEIQHFRTWFWNLPLLYPSLSSPLFRFILIVWLGNVDESWSEEEGKLFEEHLFTIGRDFSTIAVIFFISIPPTLITITPNPPFLILIFRRSLKIRLWGTWSLSTICGKRLKPSKSGNS